jgi:hypothetical protein
MAIYRAQVSWGGDTSFPRDRMVITPHFKDTNLPGTGDVQGLADDLATGIAALTQPGSGGREVIVKMYDAESHPSGPPLATKILSPGVTPAATAPREIALCLSFFSGTNTPSRRGRLYLPVVCFWGSAISSARPTTTQQDAAAAFVPVFTELGGVDVDWVVYSRKNNSAHSVTNWFIDDEWDTQRRRGLRPSARKVGTTSE